MRVKVSFFSAELLSLGSPPSVPEERQRQDSFLHYEANSYIMRWLYYTVFSVMYVENIGTKGILILSWKVRA